MARGKQQKMVECPKCFHHFDRRLDIIHKLCTRCNQWRPLIDYLGINAVCKICKGIPISRFSTQLRMRTKEGLLLKQCTKCKLWKPEDSFSKEPCAGDNLQSWCIDCNNDFQAAKRKEDKEKK